MSAQPPKPQPSDLAALAAQRQTRPRPKPVKGEGAKGPAQEGEGASGGTMGVDSSPSSMASGFVAMLAKGQTSRSTGSGATGKGGAASGGVGRDKAAYGLKMAREVVEGEEVGEAGKGSAEKMDPLVAALEESAEFSKSAGNGEERGRSRLVGGVLVMLGMVLMVIGIWAVGALVYMGRVVPTVPEEVRYPLITWDYQPGEGVGEGVRGGYTEGSRMVAWGMLASLPVGLLLGWAGLRGRS